MSHRWMTKDQVLVDNDAAVADRVAVVDLPESLVGNAVADPVAASVDSGALAS